MKDSRVQINVNDNRLFFADEVSITNNPLRFVIDFKNTSPRVDFRAREGLPIIVEHNTITLDANLAKQFAKLLVNHIEQYEKEFGEIKEPEQVLKAKKNHPVRSTNNDKPGYFG